jgi:hypothetical protein
LVPSRKEKGKRGKGGREGRKENEKEQVRFGAEGAVRSPAMPAPVDHTCTLQAKIRRIMV